MPGTESIDSKPGLLGAESSDPNLGSGLVSLLLPHAMVLASDDAPDWDAAEDSLHDAQHRSDSSHEHSVPSGNLHVKRVEMLDIHEKAESDENEHEADAPMGDYERQLNNKAVIPLNRLVRVPRPTYQMLCVA